MMIRGGKIMKKTFLFVMIGVAVVFTACNKVQDVTLPEENQENGPVYITASIDSETKATLAEADGAFAFSNGDAIKVCNESGAFSGTTTSTENSGTFAMDAGFNGSTNGIAGFPASMVTTMTKSSVTFLLPASYEYTAVGGTDASAAKVPCPMIGSYNGATKKVTLKQAGSVVRFKVANIEAGSLSFTFPTKVTGQVKLSSVPSDTSDGILAANLSTAGNTITVSDVPTVTGDNFIFITIPVPTGTAPQNILVTNTPSGAGANKLQNLSGSATPLERAQGWKLGVSPSSTAVISGFTINAGGGKVVLAPGNLMAKIGSYDVILDESDDGNNNANVVVGTASQWKFGGAYEVVGAVSGSANDLFAQGNDACINQWIDLFYWQGNSVANVNRHHGIVSSTNDRARKNATRNPEDTHSPKYYNSVCATDVPAWSGNVPGEKLYANCWDGLTISNGGEYTWRVLSKAEWDYILETRTTNTLNSVANARFSRATVSGINGLLIFPDNISDALWETTGIATKPKDINCPQTNYYKTKPSKDYAEGPTPNYVEYSGEDMIAMASIGIVFLPNAGWIRSYNGNPGGGLGAFNEVGYYWTNDSWPTGEDVGSGVNNSGKRGEYGAYYVNVHYIQNTKVSQWSRAVGRSVRLARDI